MANSPIVLYGQTLVYGLGKFSAVLLPGEFVFSVHLLVRPQCTEDQAALGEISVHHLHPWLIMFGTKTVAAAVKINVGRMVVKIILEKIKKEEKKGGNNHNI